MCSSRHWVITIITIDIDQLLWLLSSLAINNTFYLACQKKAKKCLTKKDEPMYVSFVNIFHESKNIQRLGMVDIILSNVQLVSVFQWRREQVLKHKAYSVDVIPDMTWITLDALIVLWGIPSSVISPESRVWLKSVKSGILPTSLANSRSLEKLF